MSHILLITSSPREGSYSTLVARRLADHLASRRQGASVTVRDLVHAPLPHIDDSFATARNLPVETLSASQRSALALSDKLLEELFAAEIVIVAAPMINFSIPSGLKSYIDHITRAGITFRFSEQGPQGLLTGKKVYLVLARGGVYTQGPMQSLDFQGPYLQAILGFLGLKDIELITIEGVAFGPESTERAVAQALTQVSEIAS